MTREEVAAHIMSMQRTVGKGKKALHPRAITNGELIIGATYKNEAIALWHHDDPVDASTLQSMFHEAYNRNLNKPLHVYGRCCNIGETPTFIFHQIDF